MVFYITTGYFKCYRDTFGHKLEHKALWVLETRVYMGKVKEQNLQWELHLFVFDTA